jgi:hypothetical protein
MPGVKWLGPCTNQYAGNDGRLFLVSHDQEGNGSLLGLVNSNNGGNPVSCHIWSPKVAPTIADCEMYVDFDDSSWAQMAANRIAVAIENEGFETEPFTQDQINNNGAIFAELHINYGMPLQLSNHDGPGGLTSHCFYPVGDPAGIEACVPDPAWGGHPCPGPIRVLQLPQILAVAQAIVNPPDNPPPPPEDPLIATLIANGNLHFAYVDTAGQLVVTWHRPKGNWNPENIEGATGLPTQTPALVDFGGAIYVFVVGPNGGPMAYYAVPGKPFVPVTV